VFLIIGTVEMEVEEGRGAHHQQARFMNISRESADTV
jgi:hypothetical protein